MSALLFLIQACGEPEVEFEEGDPYIERLLVPTATPEPAGPPYRVAGRVLGSTLAECTLWACGNVHELQTAEFAIDVTDEPCRVQVDCRDDGRIGTGNVLQASRTAAGELPLRYPTISEMHVLTEAGERELQSVADFFRRLSADTSRSEAKRGDLARHADHLEHQIRRAQERRAQGE